MSRLQISLTLRSISALSAGAGGSAGTIADKTIVRDGWGRPVIPGSQVKGKLRSTVEQLLRGFGQTVPAPFDEQIERPGLVRTLFGSPMQRSPLHFADLPVVIGPVEQAAALRDSPEQRASQIRPSVAINRRRGTAEDARLLFQETAPEIATFFAARAIIGDIPGPGHAALLWAGLRLATRWGGASSRGLGWSAVTAQIQIDGATLGEDELAAALRDLLGTEGPVV